MMCCEKCWNDAYLLSLTNNKSQAENYHELLEERKDKPCSPKEQAGQFWDEIYEVDKRVNDIPKKIREIIFKDYKFLELKSKLGANND